MEQALSELNIFNALQLLGLKLINPDNLGQLFFLFTFNALSLLLIIHFVYARNSKNKVRKEFYFNFFGIGIIVFLLCYLLSNIKMELGFALGLFAIFRIVRYRTETLPIKEMTYLFIVIGISVINAFSSQKLSYAELFFANAIVITGLWLVEKRLLKNDENSVRLIYEKIENIHSKNQKELLADLNHRTGLNVQRFEIRKIDFLRDSAEIEVFYNERKDSK